MKNDFDELEAFNQTFKIHTNTEHIIKHKQKPIDPSDIFKGVKKVKGKGYRKSNADKEIKTIVNKDYLDL